MEHTMNLHPSPFSKIKTGVKTIELRLYDEKRRAITPGDTIRFYNRDNTSEWFLTRVTELSVFDTFEELYQALPLLQCGYTTETLGSASPKDMLQYYSPEQQKQFGVVGIHVQVL